MKSRACVRAWEIAPYREGRLEGADARSFERHLAGCAECRQELAGDERLRTRALEAYQEGETSELAMRRVRARVLRDAEQGRLPVKRPSPWVLGVGAAATCAAIAGAWVATTRPPRAPSSETRSASPPAPVPSTASEFAATVAPSDGARWSQQRAHGVERVTLEEGTLRVHVRPQRVGERFLVVLPDGELEVRGTTFDVRVVARVTLAVHVDEGVVELRLAGQPARRLTAGEDWPPIPQGRMSGVVAASSAASAPSLSSLPPLPPIAARPRPSPPFVSTAPAADDEYARAMGLLRAGKDDEAATAVPAFAQGHPDASQAEDSS
ncbi:MAG TPA: zf-HC2 domain-containing protein, partial [Polyangiaceae bacterium]